jgi:membrane-associated phospholipid phosphatase
MKFYLALSCIFLFGTVLYASDGPSRSGSSGTTPIQFERTVKNFSSVRLVRHAYFQNEDSQQAAASQIQSSVVETERSSKSTKQHDDIFDDFSSPVSFARPAVIVAGSFIITAALINSDPRTYQTIHGWRQANPAVRTISPIITELGDGRTSMAMFGGLLAYSYVADDHSALQAGKLGLESFLISGIVTQLLKHTFSRERPSAASEPGGRWSGAFAYLSQNPNHRDGMSRFDAFPSGHTATAFAAAATFSEVYKTSPWVSYASYSLATGVAVSRVMERTHWVSDCFVGGLIGYFSAQLVIHLNNSEKPIAVVPVLNKDNMGMALSLGF